MRYLKVPVMALLSLLFAGKVSAQASHKKALLIIDVQNDYFKGGKMELSEPDVAAANISLILAESRKKGIPVIHVQHAATEGFLVANTTGAEIHASVRPVAGEKIITKHYPNSFRETTLAEYLKAAGITDLVITGMMTHACVDATTRAAKDLGFNCTVIADACATRDLEVNHQLVPAAEVQRSLMGALAFYYAAIVNTKEYLNR
ncbi:cysteine hydrolase family protein [Chitinophaga solisilvae]|uniref:cysteine hydrolase family protein n=1 Tax=Chitinophaga solisilvae TaxID=1233460 RepID=UPI001923CE17|nr:cysteine hydrolase family protein [Chitinophaga solisilvae]